MATGPDGSVSRKLLLLEAHPGSLAAFRNGVDDVLVHPLCQDVLIDSGARVSRREKLDARRALTQQMAKCSLDDLVLLKAIGETTRSAEDLQKLLDQIVDLIRSAPDVDIVSLMLGDDQGILKIRAACGLPENVRREVTIAPGEGVSGHVMALGEPVLIDDLSTDGRFAGLFCDR